MVYSAKTIHVKITFGICWSYIYITPQKCIIWLFYSWIIICVTILYSDTKVCLQFTGISMWWTTNFGIFPRDGSGKVTKPTDLHCQGRLISEVSVKSFDILYKFYCVLNICVCILFIVSICCYYIDCSFTPVFYWIHVHVSILGKKQWKKSVMDTST